jgi:hypothetical protein
MSRESPDNRELEKEELLLSLTQRLYDAEVQRTKELDQKAGSLIGYVTIVTGLLIGLGTFSIPKLLASPLFFLLYILGIGLLLASIVSSLAAIRLRKWYSSPTIEDLNRYLDNSSILYRSVVRTSFIRMGEATTENFIKKRSESELDN